MEKWNGPSCKMWCISKISEEGEKRGGNRNLREQVLERRENASGGCISRIEFAGDISGMDVEDDR